jgi:hypothetical protein
MADKICGIEVDAFTLKPTPEELGTIVAHWNDADQAEFFISLANRLRDCCGFKDESQICWIARTIVERETEILNGLGSEFIEKLSWFIKENDNSKAEPAQ